MDLTIKPLNFALPVSAIDALPKRSEGVAAPGFKEAILKALQETSDLQAESGRLSKEFTLDNPTVSLEATMMAGVKSGIAFQATLQVRNKVVQAYNDIMNMQV